MLPTNGAWIRTPAIVVLLPLLAVDPLSAQAGNTPADTVEVVPGAIYEAGGLRRFLLGDHYRDVWTTPIAVPVLDLGRFAGGLTPISAHAGSQTRSLRFRGADGRSYQFRSVFKTLMGGLPAHLQQTLVADLLQDGASVSHPGGTLVVSPLLEAVGVLRPEPVMVVMPDDPTIG